MHFVLFCVKSFNLLPIPAAKINACIVLPHSFVSAGNEPDSLCIDGGCHENRTPTYYRGCSAKHIGQTGNDIFTSRLSVRLIIIQIIVEELLPLCFHGIFIVSGILDKSYDMV